MILWRLADPKDATFAAAAWRGAWSDGTLCQECGSSTEDRIQPLIMEWEAGADRIGDFTCTGVCDGFAIVESVGRELQARFKGFELGPVKMIQQPSLTRPKRTTKQIQPRVWLPYAGPTLQELWVTAAVRMDAGRTTARLARRCTKCGEERYELRGMQRIDWNWDKAKRQMLYVHVPRAPGEGLYVRARDLRGADVFRVHEFSGWVLCTDSVKDFVEEAGFTNIRFMEMGDVI